MDNSNDIVKLSTPAKHILQITLNRPQQLNALSHEVLKQLEHIFHTVKQDKSIKAVLLTGEGKAFCAGADIKQLAMLKGPDGLQFARFGQMVFRTLEKLGKPSLAAIHGFAFGGGCELAMAASMRIASDNTVFGQPEIKLGVIPGFGGTQRLARLIGKARALEICLTGRKVMADEAYRFGLVNELTKPENLLTRALEILQELVQLGSFAMESIIHTINAGYNLTLEEAMDIEAAYFGLCCATPDKSEGVNAFLEKRTAVFNGE